MLPAPSPATTGLAPPPEGIYRSFDDLLAAVQRVAKDNGYGVVKLRASNYREGKPTRYDLVCDRGGVKYSSTAKKRNPSTRKVDCPFRAKAVCEVQLGNQWRFQVQEPRHNHEARVPAALPGQENTPLAQTMRSMTNKIDRLAHDMAHGYAQMNGRFDSVEKRLESMEHRLAIGNMGAGMGGGMGANMGGGMGGGISGGMGGGMGGNLPANMGNTLGGSMGNPSSVLENRMNGVEARMNAMESRANGLDMPMDEVDSRLLSSTVI